MVLLLLGCLVFIILGWDWLLGFVVFRFWLIVVVWFNSVVTACFLFVILFDCVYYAFKRWFAYCLLCVDFS